MSRRMKLKATSPQNTKRVKNLQKRLKGSGLDACLIESSVDLFYFTGLKLSAGRLLVHEKSSLLLVDGRYLQIAKEKSKLPTALDSPAEFEAFCKKNRIIRLGFDGGHTSYDQYKRLKKGFKVELVPSTPFFKVCRSIKDRAEISAMKKSAELLWQGFQFLRKSLKKGITEKELSKRFEIFCLERGAERLAFEPIIAFGKNSAMPHYRSHDVPLKEGDIVLIDIGIVLDGYNSDMTRVVFFKKEDPYLSRLYEIAKEAQKSALKHCRPGVKLKELDLSARKVMAREKVEELFVHGLGHGVGLECHEFPRVNSKGEDKDIVLEEGMVITVEPGLYVPGKGGVRYEDTVVVTAKGHLNFYPDAV